MRARAPARVLCADPPWPFGDRLGRRGAAAHYRSMMSVAQIARFALPALAPNAWLFMWRVAAMQEEALFVARAWGFRVVSEIVWEKTTKRGADHFGLGRYVRAAHETCLIATRGRVRPAVRNVRSRFRAPVGRHSEKPEVFYEIVERLTGSGPYVELFARRRRKGWVCIGDELPGAKAA